MIKIGIKVFQTSCISVRVYNIVSFVTDSNEGLC